MKVRLEKEDKRFLTMMEAPIVNQIIASMKEDECTPAEYAEMAIRTAYNGNAWDIDVLTATAKISRNDRTYNLYTDKSGYLDIWITATAFLNSLEGDEFIKIGAYLSDIWQITSNNHEEIASHMYIRKFREVK